MWKLNVAHVFFMQDTRFPGEGRGVGGWSTVHPRKHFESLELGPRISERGRECAEAIKYYEPFVKPNLDNILSVPAMVLANLCVSFIMTSQNEKAEDLLRKARPLHTFG